MNHNRRDAMAQAPRSAFELRYKILVDDIKFAKLQQWRITYYIILTFAAIIGIYALLQPKVTRIYTSIQVEDLQPVHTLIEPRQMRQDGRDISSSEKGSLVVSAFLLTWLGILHVTDCHRRMCEYRTRILEIEPLIESLNEKEKHYDRFERYLYSITMPFIFLLIFGCCSVAWIVWRKDYAFPSIVTLTLLINVVFALGVVLYHCHKLNRWQNKRRKKDKAKGTP
jgi:hypothetical protein